jgi:hypothetical protein
MTKGEFNRLGDRLIAHERPSESDLAQLRAVLGVYQEVLGQVKDHLHSLGFAPTDRVKTTTTMTDKYAGHMGWNLAAYRTLLGRG